MQNIWCSLVGNDTDLTGRYVELGVFTTLDKWNNVIFAVHVHVPMTVEVGIWDGVKSAQSWTFTRESEALDRVRILAEVMAARWKIGWLRGEAAMALRKVVWSVDMSPAEKLCLMINVVEEISQAREDHIEMSG